MYSGLISASVDRSRSISTSEKLPVVFVVDDDISIRESLELLIVSEGWRPELFASAQTFLARERVDVPNCLILDVNLPGLNGLELQTLISDERTETPIIFLTGVGDVPMTVKAMKSGAIEFFTKPFNHGELLAAVAQALQRSEAILSLENKLNLLRKRHASLTRRERQVMSLVVAGLLNKQVAFELGISEITVKAHRGRVMRKMQARSLPGLVRMVAALGTDKQHLSGADPMDAMTP